jgi:hypothetical protein
MAIEMVKPMPTSPLTGLRAQRCGVEPCSVQPPAPLSRAEHYVSRQPAATTLECGRLARRARQAKRFRRAGHENQRRQVSAENRDMAPDAQQNLGAESEGINDERLRVSGAGTDKELDSPVPQTQADVVRRWRDSPLAAM